MTPARSYLDHAATTPVLPQVIEAMADAMRAGGNASSVHTTGREARRRVEESRELIAAQIGARPSEVIFTSGGTESDNLALQGIWRAQRMADPRRRRLVVSAVEHSAVLDCAQALIAEGAVVTRVPVDRQGLVDPEAVREAILGGPPDAAGPESVAVVSLMWVNNEVGTVQPVTEVAAIAHEYGIPMHTDAAQALGHLPFDLAASGAGCVSLSSHKMGGPAGVGVLVASRELPIVALTHGGGQERQLRSGTLAMPLVVGMALAVRLAVERMPSQVPRLTALRDRLLTGAIAAVEHTTVTGLWQPGDALSRSPANAHLLLPDCEADSLLFLLDAAGIDCSTGSACHAGIPQPSHVVLAMGYPQEQARGALRLSLGHSSSEADVDAFLAALPDAVERAQRAHRARLAHRSR